MSLSRQDCWYDKVCSIGGDDCINHCIRYEEMAHLMSSSGLPQFMQRPPRISPEECDLASFRRLQSIKENIVEFVKNGNNLYICSSTTGNGKTTWAIKLLLKYFNEIWAGNGFRTRGMFVSVSSLLIQLKDFNNPLSREYKDNLLTCDLVVFDDIASTDMSNYDYTQLLTIIDQRVLSGKSTIFTGNVVEPSMLTKYVGSKITSRIYSKNTEIIEFKGGDRR